MFELVTGIKSLSTHFAIGDTDNDSFFDLHSTALGVWLSKRYKNAIRASLIDLSDIVINHVDAWLEHVKLIFVRMNVFPMIR